MTYELRELNMNMGRPEYEMYQDIPLKESGSTNLCNGLPYNVFSNYLESQLARKYQTISDYDTPTRIFLLYVNNYPVGYIGLRLELDDNWKKWSGNFYYAIRQSEREKGYGYKILEMGLEKLKEFGMTEIYGQSSNGNISSAKIIEKNGGLLLKEEDGTRYYKITL